MRRPKVHYNPDLQECPLCKKWKCMKRICREILTGCGYYEDGVIKVSKTGIKKYRKLAN